MRSIATSGKHHALGAIYCGGYVVSLAKQTQEQSRKPVRRAIITVHQLQPVTRLPRRPETRY